MRSKMLVRGKRVGTSRGERGIHRQAQIRRSGLYIEITRKTPKVFTTVNVINRAAAG